MFVKLDDDVVAVYQHMATEFKQPLEVLLTRQLTRFSAFPPTKRAVVLSGDYLNVVEKALGGGQLQTPKQLAERVVDRATVTLGKIALDFTPAQQEEILHRAAKQGKSPDDVVKEMLQGIEDQMFNGVTPYR